MGARKKEALEQFNRDNIVSAARELFEQKGIERTTMDDIAKEADYSKSTIYVYFKSKEEIYNAILKEYVDSLIETLDGFIEDDSDFERKYYGFCDLLVGFEEQYPKYYASLMGETRITNSRKLVSVTDMGVANDLMDCIHDLIQFGLKAKVLRKDVEIWPTVYYMWSAIGGVIQLASRIGESMYAKLEMTKDEYLRYAFRRIYASLVGR